LNFDLEKEGEYLPSQNFVPKPEVAGWPHIFWPIESSFSLVELLLNNPENGKNKFEMSMFVFLRAFFEIYNRNGAAEPKLWQRADH
jgi:hypothetical protein